MQTLKKTLLSILSFFGFFSLSQVIKIFKIPDITLFNEIKKNKIKYYYFLNRYYFTNSSISDLLERLKNNYIHQIKVDEVAFKLSFLNYTLDKGITERIQGKREPNTVSVIRSLVKKGNKVLELGACYGYFTYLMSVCAGNKGKIVSIEGLPNNFRILKNNMNLNKCSNVSIYNYFISSSSDNNSISFNKNSTSPYVDIERFLSQKKFSGVTDSDLVETIKISSFLRKINFCPDNVFMDIEGFEVDVIEDFHKNNFFSKKPTIVFEIHNSIYNKNKNLKYLKSLLKKNYECRQDSGNLICIPN
jgi:FkbM family methyltransferase